MLVRGVRRIDQPGEQWVRYEHRGKVRAGCDDHPVYPYVYNQQDRMTGRLVDDQHRAIPLG